MEEIHAGGVVLARLVLASSYIYFACISSPTIFADALEATNFISTGCSIQTRVRKAIVDVGFASNSSESFSALANEFVIQIDAMLSANWTARIAKAFVDFRFALKPNESWSAFADKAFELVNARGSVLAGF